VFLKVFVLFVCITIKAFAPSENPFFKLLLSIHSYHASPVHSSFLESFLRIFS